MGYEAVYSDGKSGADAPFGAGYGGNDSGYADVHGKYVATFVIKPSAPAGPAFVRVVVAGDGGFHHGRADFRVAATTLDC